MKDEFKNWCKQLFARYKINHPPPLLHQFCSGGDYFNAAEAWSERWHKYIAPLAGGWFKLRGYRISYWTRCEPLEVEKD